MGPAALDHIGLSVRDLPSQAAWYGKALGLRAAAPLTVAPLRMKIQFMVDDHGISIELIEREGGQPGERGRFPHEAALIHGYGHICLRVSDVDAVHAALLAAGGRERMAPQDSPEPGVRMSFVADPEDNLIELIDRKGPMQP